MAGLFYGEEKGGGVPVLFRHDLLPVRLWIIELSRNRRWL